MPVRIEVAEPSRICDLEAPWRALENDATEASAFQRWTWMGCLAQERFPRPLVVRAEADGEVVGLALFNRRRGGLYLSESGDTQLDAPYIEHNGPLISPRAPAGTVAMMMRSAWRAGSVLHAALSGVPPEVAATAGGWAWRRIEHPAPRVELGPIRASGSDYLASLSANTRQQLRRSMRAAAADGDVALERAATVQEASAWFDELVRLHREVWRRRGQRGAFAGSFVRRFHLALIERGVACGEVDLLRARAGERILGYLYNLQCSGWICAYQSGWAASRGGADDRPGIVCHVLAIEAALRSGARRYDFLAGDARYKRSLATASARLVWLRAALPRLRLAAEVGSPAR
jgi:CelD/BcsL family acetyltransferase involved in cellulose biosynthesis